MKLHPLLLPVLSFVAGAAVFACSRLGSSGWGGGGADEAPTEFSKAQASGGRMARSSAGASSTPLSASAEILTFTGLTASPTLDDIFNANGLDRTLRMAVYLQTASSADLEAVIARCREEQIYDLSLTDQVWMRWVEIDRDAAFKSDAGGTAVWWAWAKLDPKAAVAAAAQAKPANLQEVIRSIGQGDHSAAIQLLSEYPAADTPLVWEGILNGLSKTDRGAAAALALEKNLKLDVYVGGWVAREPEQAMAWVRGLEDPIQHRRVLDLAVKELIASDPAAGLREIATLPAGRSRTERTAEAIAALSRSDPAAARAAADALPNPADRQRARIDLAETLAARDPAAALSIVVGLSWSAPSSLLSWTYEGEHGRSNGSTSSSAADSQGIRQLMQTSPEATASALAALPPERKAPLNQAIQQWAGQQPEAASQWVNGQPAGPVKDEAIQGLTVWLTQLSPEPDYEAALAWSAAASTPDQQYSIIQSALWRWKEQDWKAARAAVDRLPLAPEKREQLLQSFN